MAEYWVLDTNLLVDAGLHLWQIRHRPSRPAIPLPYLRDAATYGEFVRWCRSKQVATLQSVLAEAGWVARGQLRAVPHEVDTRAPQVAASIAEVSTVIGGRIHELTKAVRFIRELGPVDSALLALREQLGHQATLLTMDQALRTFCRERDIPCQHFHPL